MWQVWAGPLSENRVVVVLWNKSSSKATVTASWSDIGLDSQKVVDARDLWAVRNNFNSKFKILSESL